jgi:hypothetical protein
VPRRLRRSATPERSTYTAELPGDLLARLVAAGLNGELDVAAIGAGRRRYGRTPGPDTNAWFRIAVSPLPGLGHWHWAGKCSL